MPFPLLGDANRTSLKYFKEVAWADTPALVAMQQLRFTKESLAYDKKTVVSNEIRSDRQVPDIVEVGDSASGAIDIEFSATSYEDFLLAFLGQSAWTPVVGPPAHRTATNGVVKSSFLIEKQFTDLTNAFLWYEGMRVNTFNLNLNAQQIVTGSFGFMGRLAATSTATTASSTTPATTTAILSASANVASIKYNGTPIAVVKRLDMNGSNNCGEQPVIASKYPTGIREGRFELKGTLEAYVQDLTLFTDLIQHNSVALDFSMTDGTNTVEFAIPTVKLTRGNPNATGINTDVMLPLEWEAKLDSVSGAMVTVTLTP